MAASPDGAPGLKRSITLPWLILYGLGTLVGGGFYALLGRVAGEAGLQAPLAVLVAAAIALLSALSFGELAARHPVSAGESYYVQRAFGRTGLSVAVGWLVITTGVVSAATLANAIVLFVQDAFALHRELGIACVVLALGLVTAWGIGQSVAVAVAITFVEVAGLLFVIGISGPAYARLGEVWTELVPAADPGAWTGIGAGAFLIFYAFIGFEDLVNVAEEVKRPRRNLPIAIVASLVLTTLLYLAVMLAAVLAMPAAELAASRTPLAALVERAGWHAGPAMRAISVLAGVNGALVQLVMASRVAYGMGVKGLGLPWLGVVSSRTRTPLRATLLVTAIVLVLALWLPLVPLAKATSSIILVIFAVVNAALLGIQLREPDPHGEGPRLPRWVPCAGAAASLALLAFQLFA